MANIESRVGNLRKEIEADLQAQVKRRDELATLISEVAAAHKDASGLWSLAGVISATIDGYKSVLKNWPPAP